MKPISDYIRESQIGTIDIDGLSNSEIKRVASKLSNLAKRQGYDIGDVYFQMAFKRLYGQGIYIDFNDIKFDKVVSRYSHGGVGDLDVMVVYFKDPNSPMGLGPKFYDDNEEDWFKYLKK